MPWIVTKKTSKNSEGKSTKYIVKSKDSGKTYHTNNPERLERLHEYYKNKGVK